jgi:glutamate-1-semialdehyde 2,1-aminomutase
MVRDGAGRNATIDGLLAEARLRYTADNPASAAAHRRAAETMPGGNTRTVLFHPPFPLTMTRGQGCLLWDADGHEYVDLLGEYTAGLYGHSHPVIRAAIDRALDGGWNLGGHGRMEAALAELVCARFPSIDLVRFTNSGTEANLLAIAAAVAATGRRGVMVFEGGYHGGVLSFPAGGMPLNLPHRWVVGRYNDVAGAAALIDANAGDLACILVEPMQGSGGCIPGTPAFLQELRDGATRTGALLIFDEVMTSRMSAGGQQARLGIVPDMTTLGKYIGGGMSFGAFGGRREIMQRFDPRRPDAWPHAGTFNNNVLTMAAGHAGLSQVFTPEVADELFASGEALRQALNEVSPPPMHWTGLGSLMSVHFSPALEPMRELFFLEMLSKGFYLARRGMLALSLQIGAPERAAFRSAVASFGETHARMF